MGMLNVNYIASFLRGEQNRNAENDDGNNGEEPAPFILPDEEEAVDLEIDHEEYRRIADRERLQLEILEAIEALRVHFRFNAQFYANALDNQPLVRSRRPISIRQMFPTAIQEMREFINNAREFVNTTEEFVRSVPREMAEQRISRFHSVLRHLILIDNYIDNYISSIFAFVFSFSESVGTFRSPRMAFRDVVVFSWNTTKIYTRFIWIAFSAAYHFLFDK